MSLWILEGGKTVWIHKHRNGGYNMLAECNNTLNIEDDKKWISQSTITSLV